MKKHFTVNTCDIENAPSQAHPNHILKRRRNQNTAKRIRGGGAYSPGYSILGQLISFFEAKRQSHSYLRSHLPTHLPFERENIDQTLPGSEPFCFPSCVGGGPGRRASTLLIGKVEGLIQRRCIQGNPRLMKCSCAAGCLGTRQGRPEHYHCYLIGPSFPTPSCRQSRVLLPWSSSGLIASQDVNAPKTLLEFKKGGKTTLT